MPTTLELVGNPGHLPLPTNSGIDLLTLAEYELTVIGADTETHLMGMGNLAPKLVCLTAADDESKVIFVNNEMDKVRNTVESLLSGQVVSVWQNAKFDLAVIACNFPDLLPLVFDALDKGIVHCTIIREKLLVLAETGDLKFNDPSGQTTRRIGFGLADLVRTNISPDLAAQIEAKKDGDEDLWRFNYSILDNIPLALWPKEAVEYAVDDAYLARQIWIAQEKRRIRLLIERGIDPFATQGFRVMADFSLYLLSMYGAKIDNTYKQSLIEKLVHELRPDRLDLLIKHGILIPETPPRPHAKGTIDKETGKVKIVKGTDEKISQTTLKAYIAKLAENNADIKLKRTDPSPRFPEGSISTDAEWLEEYAPYDPVLEQYQHRQALIKLRDTEIPRMSLRDRDGNVIGDAEIAHPMFDILKETGRTSSYASKLYPSFGCQNPREDIRGCVEARPGRFMVSCDLSSMELVTFGQTCKNMLGYSTMADTINAGRDPHAWLGSQIALKTSGEFAGYLRAGNIDINDPHAVYDFFVSLKKSKDAQQQETFKHFRKLAKPTGLGYPGGLGPDKFMVYAQGTFGVEIDRDTAVLLREIWREAFPEAKPYFKFITENLKDRHNVGPVREDRFTRESRPEELYCYTSPMGMVRSGAGYTAACNGVGLQTPGAEGALTGLINVVRACYDQRYNSILFGRLFPMFFIHDEIVAEVLDDAYTHEVCQEFGRIFETAFRVVTPDVTIKAAPALMRRWNKAAEPVFDANGRLIPWEPKAS